MEIRKFNETAKTETDFIIDKETPKLTDDSIFQLQSSSR